ncbi:MAG: hypothetical protein IPM26_08925 [Saprospiraceae bacterium]|nr:hypothetical protein [Saprospiraceae bacterium]
MLRYPYMMQAGVMVASAPSGNIRLDKKKRPQINFSFSSAELLSLKRGIQTLSAIFLLGGALRVLPSSFKKLEVREFGDIPKIHEWIQKNDDIMWGSAHPQGGNRMNENKSKGVVGCNFEVHGMKNLFIADTSVWPTNIKANCQATAMAMAKYASKFVTL